MESTGSEWGRMLFYHVYLFFMKILRVTSAAQAKPCSARYEYMGIHDTSI
jgi:hypothetical protein